MTTFNGAVTNQTIDMRALHDDVQFGDRIDNSIVTIDTDPGSVYVFDRIDGNSVVKFLAGGDVAVRGRIDGNSIVKCVAAGDITVGDRIAGNARVFFLAARDVVIGGQINNNSQVFIKVSAGQRISLNDTVDGGSHVYYWPPGCISFQQVAGGSVIEESNWESDLLSALPEGRRPLGAVVRTEPTPGVVHDPVATTQTPAGA